MSAPQKYRVWDHITKSFYYFDIRSTMGVIPNDIPNDAIQQFTGIIDKNGEGIYEGDILEFRHGADFATGSRSPVIWVSCMNGSDWTGWYCQAAGYSGRYQNGEVVGNIFENPEL